MARPRTVVFDFDGVLVAHDSTGELIRQRLMKRPLSLLAAVPGALVLPLGRFSPAVHRGVSRQLIRLSRIERSGTVDDDVRAFGRSLAHRPGWPVTEAIDALRTHIEAGDQVLVASASLETCVRAYLAEFGLGDVDVVGSRLAADGYPAVHTYHAEKVRVAQRKGWGTPWDHVYSDSIRDMPMFAVARHVTLVNVGDRTYARVAARVDAHVDRVRWR